jgi:hypothetical protein
MAAKVLSFIEKTITGIEEQLALNPPGRPSVKLKRITGLKPQNEDGELQWKAKDHEVVYSFPGKTKEEAWRFGRISLRCSILLMLQLASFAS